MEILSFPTSAKFRAWLRKNHKDCPGIWLRIYKKDSEMATVTYAEALDEALCYGWIDSQRKTFDKKSFIQKFTPRKARSVWSKRNREHVERLVKSKKMRSAGLLEVNAAKKDGRWEAAYDAFRDTKLPEDFLKEMAKNKKAKAFFATLNKTNLFSIAYRLQSAKKPETREKRKKAIIEMLAKGEKFH